MPSNIFQDARYIQKHPCKKFTLKNEMQQKGFEDMKGHYQHFGVAFVKLRKRDIFIERMRKKSTTMKNLDFVDKSQESYSKNSKTVNDKCV